jgi:serine/threonine-protein kinase
MLQIANRFLIHDPPHDRVGHGGMGDVYRANDTQTGQIVAVKELKSDIVADTPEMVTRFVREGEVLGKLNHPYIVTWVEAVEENGRYYLIMEYVGGGSLRDKLRQQGALPLPEVLQLAYALADALTHAHNLHIIHRDLKPDNVLLAEDSTPRLTDFGIAYVADRTRLTDSDMLMGTFGYHSPEAFRGQTLDERADIWSLGVMVYEMLVGERRCH